MTAPVRRAGAFAALATLSLVVPLLGVVPAAAVAAATVVVAVVVTDGPVFDLLAFPSDREDGRLYGLLTFALAAITLGIVTVRWTMPVGIFVGTLVLVGYGAFAEELARRHSDADLLPVAAFTAVGLLAAVAGQVASRAFADDAVGPELPTMIFLAGSGALLAALVRDALISDDDPVVVLAVGLLLWLLAEFDPSTDATGIVLALAVTVATGYASYALGAASITGMLTGTLLALVTIVFGGYDWFAVLVSFFGIGSLSTKVRYEEKVVRGVAEANDGARGSGNVLGNSAVALGAVLGYAASSADLLPGEATLFLFAFAGSVATAMSDTLSSEIGGIFDSPRLITTLEPVDPGTDGGVTWQGELAGLAGATVVAAICYAFFPEVDAAAAAVVVAAGVVGMTVDSLLGATLEGPVLGNQGVNFLATFAGAIACVLFGLSAAILG